MVLSGWTTLADHAARTRLLAVDGPEIAAWNELAGRLRRELGERGVAVHALDAREGMASWESTSSTELADDPDSRPGRHLRLSCSAGSYRHDLC